MTAILASIKTRGLLPTSQQTYTDSDLITLANDELQIGVVPFIMKFRSEYYVTDEQDAIVSNKDSYDIPTRAIGGKVRNLCVVDNLDNEYDLPQIAKEDRKFYNTQSGNANFNAFVFYFEGNAVKICPKPTNVTSQTYLKQAYYIRPSQLIASSSAAQITAIDTGLLQVTVNIVPTGMSASTPIDFVRGTPGFECRAIDITPVSLAGTIFTFSSLPESLAVGDWISLANTSPIPQIPLELFSMLSQRVVVKVMEGLGDAQGLQIAQSKLKEMEDAAAHLLSPRSDGNPKKLINRYSPLRAWGNGWGGGYSGS